MTTLQSIVYALVQGLTFLIPVSTDAHFKLIHQAFEWDLPTPALVAAILTGISLGLIVFFRHDWPSFFSSLLQVIIFRRKPMTLDERMPFFLLFSSLPVLAFAEWKQNPIQQLDPSAIGVGILVAAFAIPTWFFDSMNRRTKKLLDWNSIDSALVGIFSIANLIPGAGSTLGGWWVASFRNYQRDAAAKFILFSAFPTILWKTITAHSDVAWRASAPSVELSWMSFALALIVGFLASLLSMGALMKAMERRSLSQYALYRLFLGAALVGIAWWRMRS